MVILHKFFWIGFLFLATLVTGIWLGQAGKPLNSTLSGVHKIIALAWVIFAVIRIYHLAKQTEPAAVLTTGIAILVLSMVGLIASGSVLTVPRLASTTWVTVHAIASAVAMAAFAITLRTFALHSQ